MQKPAMVVYKSHFQTLTWPCQWRILKTRDRFQCWRGRRISFVPLLGKKKYVTYLLWLFRQIWPKTLTLKELLQNLPNWNPSKQLCNLYLSCNFTSHNLVFSRLTKCMNNAHNVLLSFLNFGIWWMTEWWVLYCYLCDGGPSKYFGLGSLKVLIQPSVHHILKDGRITSAVHCWATL